MAKNDSSRNAERETSMVAVLFRDSPDFNEISRIKHSLRRACPDASIDGADDMDASLPMLFASNGFVCQAMFMDHPAPIAANDPEFRNAWFWPEAWATLSKHQSHIVLSVTGGDADRDRAILFQRLLLAVSVEDASISAFVYVPSGNILPRRALIPLAERDEPSVALFTSCAFAREAEDAFPKASILVSTKGLADLGLMELEARGYVGEVFGLHQFILNFAEYVLINKPSFRDGDTMGSEEGEKIGIRITKSLFYDEDVLRLNFQ